MRIHPIKAGAKGWIPYRDLVHDARTQQRYRIMCHSRLRITFRGCFVIRMDGNFLRQIDLGGDLGLLGHHRDNERGTSQFNGAGDDNGRPLITSQMGAAHKLSKIPVSGVCDRNS